MFSLKRDVVEEAFCGPILQRHGAETSGMAMVKVQNTIIAHWLMFRIGVCPQISRTEKTSIKWQRVMGHSPDRTVPAAL